MTATTDKHPPKPDPRRERLEAELRENLKRRKEQARARRDIGRNAPGDNQGPGEDD